MHAPSYTKFFLLYHPYRTIRLYVIQRAQVVVLQKLHMTSLYLCRK